MTNQPKRLSQIEFEFHKKVKGWDKTTPQYQQEAAAFQQQLSVYHQSSAYLQLEANFQLIGKINEPNLIQIHTQLVNLLKIGPLTEEQTKELVLIWFFLEFRMRHFVTVGRYYYGPKDVIEMEPPGQFWLLWKAYKTPLKAIGVQVWKEWNGFLIFMEREDFLQSVPRLVSLCE